MVRACKALRVHRCEHRRAVAFDCVVSNALSAHPLSRLVPYRALEQVFEPRPHALPHACEHQRKPLQNLRQTAHVVERVRQHYLLQNLAPQIHEPVPQRSHGPEHEVQQRKQKLCRCQDGCNAQVVQPRQNRVRVNRTARHAHKSSEQHAEKHYDRPEPAHCAQHARPGLQRHRRRLQHHRKKRRQRSVVRIALQRLASRRHKQKQNTPQKQITHQKTLCRACGHQQHAMPMFNNKSHRSTKRQTIFRAITLIETMEMETLFDQEALASGNTAKEYELLRHVLQ